MMTLTELEPRWITPDMFIFRCPHCQKVWLSAKRVKMTRSQVWDALRTALGDQWNEIAVPPKPEALWVMSNDYFESMSVGPSIDASASGHWHGFIKNGMIQ